MSRPTRARLLRALGAVARAWMACASAGCWPPPMLADGDDRRVCAACGRPFACPLEWRRARNGAWWVTFRCGECGHRRIESLPEADAARLMRQMAWDADAIAEEAGRLDAERMAAEVAALTAGLRRDLIGAADFAPRSRGRRTA